MRGWRGFAAGVLTLVALQVLGANRGPEQAGKLLGWLNGGLRRAMDPQIPAVPRVKAQPAASSSTRKPANANEIDNRTRGELPRNPTLYT